MKVTLFMTTSLNGIIARPDYREDFLSNSNWHSFLDRARQSGAMIWGRKTQEKARRYSPKAFEQMKDFIKVVVSTEPDYKLEEGFELANSPKEAVAMLKDRGLSEALLSGGSLLNTSFAKEGLIDNVIINIEAVIIGRGIPLFSPADFDLKLQLKETRSISEGIVQLHFIVIK